jgi:glycosyltransferase involved in cell wall biosynthesis
MLPRLFHPPRRAHFLAYDLDGASFRHRLRDVAGGLAAEGWACSVDRLPKGRYFRRLLERRRDLAAADCLVLAKVNLGLGEPVLLRLLTRCLIFDFDDAIYLRRPRSAGEAPTRSRVRDLKFDGTCAVARLVLAGNETLAIRASTRARWVEVVPTSVDVDRFAEPPPARRGNTVVWIGRPENLVYLELVRPALRTLASEIPGLTLRVVSSQFPDWPELPVERVTWSEVDEGPALMTADVGVSPLFDDGWTRGKCAFKLLQYMAASLPAVVSPVGANGMVLTPGETGYFAEGAEQWTARLREILTCPELGLAMGRAARDSVRRRFERRSSVERVVALLRAAAEQTLPPGTEPTPRQRREAGRAGGRLRSAARSTGARPSV